MSDASETNDLKYVGIVATILGGVVMLLGLFGILVTFL